MIRPRAAVALFATGLVVLAAGWFFGPHSAALTRGAVARGALMFPGLVQRLQDAAKIEITSKGHTLALDRDDGEWGVAERGDYPANPQKVRALLTGLTELRLDEPRTADPAFFSRLGLDDPNKPDASGDLVRVLDKAGKTIAAVIVGHSRVRSGGTQGGASRETVFVRAPEQDQTWLAEGRIDVDANPQSWLQRDVMNFPPDKIARVEVAASEPPRLVFVGKEGKLTLAEPAEHPPLDDLKVEEVGRALQDATFEDVRRAGSAPSGQLLGNGTFEIAGGPSITATVTKGGDAYWVSFKVEGKDAEALQHRVQGWDYKIDSWKAGNMVPTLAALKAPTPQAAQPTPGQPAPGQLTSERPAAPRSTPAPTSAPAHAEPAK